jgi:hypothetical protein
VRLTTTRGRNEGPATTSSHTVPDNTTKSYTRVQMQVSATISTKMVTETGVCMSCLHLVSDHLHLPGGHDVFFCSDGDVGSTAASSERLEGP